MESKICSRCKEAKPLDEFGLDNRRNSPKAVCRPCDSEIHKDRYKQFGITPQQKERKRLIAKVRYERRRVVKNCSDCGKRTDGGIYCRICGNERANKESATREQKRKSKVCRECGSAAVRYSRQLCDECSRSGSKRYNSYQKQWRDNQKREIIAIYGGVCACCGESNLKFLTIDHINNDGALHRKTMNPASGRARIYPWLKKHAYPSGFRVLCFNCNCGREYNGGICPHLETNQPTESQPERIT